MSENMNLLQIKPTDWICNHNMYEQKQNAYVLIRRIYVYTNVWCQINEDFKWGKGCQKNLVASTSVHFFFLAFMSTSVQFGFNRLLFENCSRKDEEGNEKWEECNKEQ